jgi:hypothetical protein
MSDQAGWIVPAAQAVATLPHWPQTHSLMPMLGARPLARALREGGRRRSAPGADHVTWAAYRRAAAVRIPRLAAALREGTWRPGPLREITIHTYTGKRLATVLPTVEDRIVHRAMRTAIEPILEAYAFADWVSGYRPGRNRLTALRHAMGHLDQGCTWVADVDVRQVSTGADAEEVTGWLAEYVYDGTFLRRFHTAVAGLPTPLAPGSGLAPLLINLRLAAADRKLAGLRVVRFTDNYCAFASNRRSAEQAYGQITYALGVIGLTPNPGKSRIREAACAEDLFLIGG